MRLPVRRITTTALCAGLLIGLSGPAVTAADGDPADADTIQSQAAGLAGLSDLLAPVTELLDTVLQADQGQLSDADANKLADAVEEALAKAEAASAGTDTDTDAGTDTDADASTDSSGAATAPDAGTSGTSTPAQPPAVTAPDADGPVTLPAPVTEPADGADPAPADGADPAAASALAAGAQAELQKRVDALVKATTSGSPEQVNPAVQDLMTGVVNVVAATLVGNGLPAADLAGLPGVPTAPEATTPEATTPETAASETAASEATTP